MSKGMKVWLWVMAGVTLYGAIGGAQSAEGGSDWLYYVGGCLVITIIGAGIIGSFSKPRQKDEPES